MWIDESLTRAINGLAGNSGLADAIVLLITNYGIPTLVLVAVINWWSPGDRPRIRHACAASALSLVLGLLINFAVIAIVHRVRPYELGITHLMVARSVDWSFPSDHATAAFAIAGPFLLDFGAARRTLFLSLAVLVSLSRVYVGTHYVGDVTGGALTGLAAAMTVAALYSRDTKLDRILTSFL